jgi:hypothetical protein
VLNVINATTHNGLATSLVDTFSSRGFTPGAATTADALAEASTIDYGPGAQDAAKTLADQFGLAANPSDAIGPNTVQLTLGADFPASDYLTGTDAARATALAASPAPSTSVTTVAATATGTAAPVPTDLSRMSVTDTPCVK